MMGDDQRVFVAGEAGLQPVDGVDHDFSAAHGRGLHLDVPPVVAVNVQNDGVGVCTAHIGIVKRVFQLRLGGKAQAVAQA